LPVIASVGCSIDYIDVANELPTIAVFPQAHRRISRNTLRHIWACIKIGLLAGTIGQRRRLPSKSHQRRKSGDTNETLKHATAPKLWKLTIRRSETSDQAQIRHNLQASLFVILITSIPTVISPEMLTYEMKEAEQACQLIENY
jgi:hypothetical protein